jgi:transposase
MALQAKDLLGGAGAAVADVGYYHGEEVQAGLQAGITPAVARPVPSAPQKLGLFRKDDCTAEGATATSQCSAGEPRTFRCATVEQGRPIRYDATAACRACPLKQQCTRNKGGRRLTRWVAAHVLAAMEQRGRSRPAVMTQRQQLVEQPVGTMKRWGEAGYFLMRGLEKVRTECSLTVLASNLRRVLNLVERPRRIAALG